MVDDIKCCVSASDIDYDKLSKKALEKSIVKLEDGLQGIEYKANSVGSSRGDYPFITFTFGEDTSNKYSNIITEAILKVRKNGQGEKGKKKCVLFPKLVFLYDENKHGEGKPYEYLYDRAIECSAKCMYPDFLSLSGENGYVSEIYQKYGRVVSPMGCRAFLSPWYEKGGMKPADDNDYPVYIGRANLGAISLNLIMIYQKSVEEHKDFYEVLDYYLEMIRQLHIRTYDYLAKMKASMNPVGFCEGGFYKGNLGLNDNIEEVIKTWTLSFGFTALNELQQLYNHHSLVEDNKFAKEVLIHINEKVNEFKEEDGKLYAIYATPAESLCGKQIEQFRKKYGIIEGVSDNSYVSNSFHCHVSENITGMEKQDRENELYHYSKGGCITYCKYPNGYNTEAIKTLVRRGMRLGLYHGVNLSLSFCNDCGHEMTSATNACEHCGSENLTSIERMNGYLSYTRVNGDTRLNQAKMDEIKDRVSM